MKKLFLNSPANSSIVFRTTKKATRKNTQTKTARKNERR